MGVKLIRSTNEAVLDDPRTTASRRRIIEEKRLLHDIYRDWYAAIASSVPPGPEPVLELGSGAGFMRTYIDRLIASDILQYLTWTSYWMRATSRFSIARSRPSR